MANKRIAKKKQHTAQEKRSVNHKPAQEKPKVETDIENQPLDVAEPVANDGIEENEQEASCVQPPICETVAAQDVVTEQPISDVQEHTELEQDAKEQEMTDQSPTEQKNEVEEQEQPTEQEQPLPQRRQKKYYPVFAFFVATILLVVASGSFIYWLFHLSQSPLLTQNVDVELPNFYGLTQKEIESDPFYAGFDITFIEMYNDEERAGTVFDQSPKPPKQVKENAHIELRVSLGVREEEVPDVVGMIRDDAEDMLKDLGLSVLIKPVFDSTEDEGTVLESDPVAGVVLQGRKTVTLQVAREEVVTTTSVPSCVGQSRKYAETLLRNAKLSAIVQPVLSDLPEGTVVNQSPRAGSVRQCGTSVVLEVSSAAAVAPAGDHIHIYTHSFVEPGPVSIGGDLHTCKICGYFYMTNVLNPTG